MELPLSLESVLELVAPLSTIELSILIGAAVVVLLGVPVVMANVRVPRVLQIVPVPHEQLTASQRRWLDGHEARLRTEGYSEALTFRVPNLPAENLSRAYISDAFPAMALATAAKHVQDGVVTGASYVEFVTEFQDGTGVTTRSSAGDDLFEPLPGSQVHVHRYVRDALDLKHAHDAHCKALGAKHPVFHRHDEFAQVLLGFHERWVLHQVDVGLLKETEEGDFGATLKLALRGVVSFFNPFEESFDLRKLAALILGGIALPMVAGLALMDARVPVVAQLQSLTGMEHALALAVAMAPVVWLSGAVAGWIFPNNTFVWPWLCAWLASRAFLGEADGSWLATGVWLVSLLLVPAAANRASTLRHRLLGRI